jgi:TolB-like protein/Flp pilus assembly protein TadD
LVSFIGELKRRSVLRVGIAYLAAIWVLLQVADIIVPLLDGPDWLVRALFFASLLGFPLAVVLAWFYDLTPEGIKTASKSDVVDSARFAGRKIDFVIIALLVLAVGILVVDDGVVPGSESEHSIAILPFSNRSVGGGDASFFADGIHNDLITLMSKLSDIRVISRKSVERYTETSQNTRQIGTELGVKSVLEGGVRIAGDRVRINVQLIEATSETDLWAEVYDRELTTTNIFGIQSEVALNIVDKLQATLSPDERERLDVVPTESLEAYEAYLLGKQAMTRRTVASLRTAVDQFQRATELDPDFALAYVGLADTYVVLQDWAYLSLEEVRPLIRAAATTAVELDDQLGEAYVTLAAIYELDGEYAEAETAYIRAIELNPGYATAHSWYSLFLRWQMGRIDEAVEHAEQALILDPLSAVLRMAYGDVLTAAGRFDDALSQYKRSIELNPEFGGAHRMIGDHYFYVSGRPYDALQAYLNAVVAQPGWKGDIGEAYLILGDVAAAERWTDQALLADPENTSVDKPLAYLNYYRRLDDVAEEFALKSLDGPLDHNTPAMLFILRNAALRDGEYDNIRNLYERFYPALAEEDPRVHLSNFRAAIDFSVVLERAGETRRSQLLLEKSLVVTHNIPRLGLFGYGSADAEIYALLGRVDEAISALRSAVDEGWWRHWYFWTERNPNLDAIRDQPEYLAIVAELESNMAIELALVKAGQSRSPETVP